MEQEDFAQKFVRVLYELNARRFAHAEFRAAREILFLTYLRGLPELYIERLEDLAEAIGTNRGNLCRTLKLLEGSQIIGRRGNRCWINDVDVWQAMPRTEHADPAKDRLSAAARTRLLDANPHQPNQLRLFPAEITDADMQAEANGAHAAARPLPGLPADCLRPEIRCKKYNGEDRNYNAEDRKNNGVVKNTTVEAVAYKVREPVRPGYQVREEEKELPGKPGGLITEEATGSQMGTPYAVHAIVEGLEKFHVAGGGEPFTADERRNWQKRARHNPLRLEVCIGEVMAHVRERRTPSIRSRAGKVKVLWSEDEQREATAAARPEDAEILRQLQAAGEAQFGRRSGS